MLANDLSPKEIVISRELMCVYKASRLKYEAYLQKEISS